MMISVTVQNLLEQKGVKNIMELTKRYVLLLFSLIVISTFFGCGNTKLEISNDSLFEAYEGVKYMDTVVACGGTPPYMWSVDNIPGLPAGLYHTTNFIMRVAGTPSTEGDYSFKVQVTDSLNKSVKKTLTMKVNEDQGISPTICFSIVSDSAPEEANLGKPYGYTLRIYGIGDALPTAIELPTYYTFSIVSGELPPGLTLWGNGYIAGEVSISIQPHEVYTCKIQCKDKNGELAMDGYFIEDNCTELSIVIKK